MLEQAQVTQALGRRDDRVLIAARLPAQHGAGLGVGGGLAVAELGDDLLDAAIEEDEIVHQLDQPLLGADLEQVFVQLEAGIVLFVFLPSQELLFRSSHRAVLHSFGVIAGEDALHGAEERRVHIDRNRFDAVVAASVAARSNAAAS